ncbi:UNVERIFIED_CONTAM: hypothetical protein HDU68_003148, partial [Siphonaria sp. JEL0065]
MTTVTPTSWAKAISEYNPASDLGCTNNTTERIRFLTTYMCTQDVFVHSEGCNEVMKAKVPSPTLCEGTCTEFGESLEEYLGNTVNCPISNDVEVKNTRTRALEAPSKCHDLVKEWHAVLPFSSKNTQCIDSVTIEYDTCGFGGDIEAAGRYCKDLKYSPHCCKTVFPTNSTTHSTAIGKSNMPPTQTSIAINNNGTKKGLGIGGISGIVAGCIFTVLASAALFVYVKRKALFPANHPTRNLLETGRLKQKAANGPTVKPRAPLSQLRVQSELNPKSPRAPLEKSYYRLPSDYEVGQISDKPAEATAPETRIVVEEYTATLPDELSLRLGESVVLLAKHDDGWARGRLTRNNQEGALPLVCVG